MIYGNCYSIILLKFKSMSMKILKKNGCFGFWLILKPWSAIFFWFSSLFKFDSYKDWWYINEMPNFYQKFHCISLLLPHVQHLQQLDLIIQTIAIRGLGTLEFKYPSIFHLLSWRHTIQFIIQAIFLCFDIVLFNIRLGPSVL